MGAKEVVVREIGTAWKRSAVNTLEERSQYDKISGVYVGPRQNKVFEEDKDLEYLKKTPEEEEESKTPLKAPEETPEPRDPISGVYLGNDEEESFKIEMFKRIESMEAKMSQ